MEALHHQKRSLISIFKASTKFSLSLHYIVDNSYLFVNGKEIFKFKVDNKNVNFPTHFCQLFPMDLVPLSVEKYL